MSEEEKRGAERVLDQDIEDELKTSYLTYAMSVIVQRTIRPAKIPNRIVNGSTGIAVGMATSIPPHNVREVCSGLISLIEKPEMTVDELMQHIPAPDFPTGAYICGKAGIRKAYH